ncbi:NAD-dependent epimerase/dehydratase family protein [Sphingomonas melonis]|uniref:NAD-dependent epimerase/dehydratase family protein n=1 Tax=Sphingomonas melonis TaxID=152682 RepID=UPI0035C7D1F8
MQHAFILGGTGQIGHSVAERLLAEGWRVTLASRTTRSAPDGRANLRHVILNRQEPRAFALALGDGADLLLDCIAFDSVDARQLVDVQNSVGTICAISSASVYRDDEGRTLDEARSNGFPEMPVPITISQPTVDPGVATYSTRKVAMERTLLDHCQTPVTILRPCAIYGPHCSHAREWFFVKRLLDGRRKIPVAYEGKSRFHTSSVQSIAAAVSAFASKPTSNVMNVVDPAAPTVTEIGRAIARVMNVEADIVGLPDRGYPPTIGVTPWSIPKPFVVAPSEAYESPGGYDSLVSHSVRWLTEAMRHRPWKEVVPALAKYPIDLFDYQAEERALRGVT